LKTLKSIDEDACDANVDDTNVTLFDNISTPSTTVGESAAKTGGRRNVVDFSLTHLRTELRNMIAGFKIRQTTKGLTLIVCTMSTLIHGCGQNFSRAFGSNGSNSGWGSRSSNSCSIVVVVVVVVVIVVV